MEDTIGLELLNPGFSGPLDRIPADPDPVHLGPSPAGYMVYDANSMRVLRVRDEWRYRAMRQEHELWLARHAPAKPAPPCPPRALTLIATNRCNLACRYCYATGRPAQDMTVETALAAVKLLDARAESWQINWFGGEPLMVFPMISATSDFIRRYADDKGIEARFGLTTNGTMITRDVAEWVRTLGVSLIISLDGCGHDAARSQSEEAAISGVRHLQQSRASTLRATFDAAPAGLLGRLKRLNRIGLGCAVAVEPALCGPTCPEAAEVAGEYREASQWFIDAIRAGGRPRFAHYEKLLTRLLKREPGLTECGAGASYLAVAPDGMIWPCHTMLGEPIGHVSRGLDESAQVWLRNAVQDQPGCMACWARYLCGGGCRLTRCERSCAYMRMMAQEVIWIAAQLTREERRAFLEMGDGRTPRGRTSVLPQTPGACTAESERRPPELAATR